MIAEMRRRPARLADSDPVPALDEMSILEVAYSEWCEARGITYAYNEWDQLWAEIEAAQHDMTAKERRRDHCGYDRRKRLAKRGNGRC